MHLTKIFEIQCKFKILKYDGQMYFHPNLYPKYGPSYIHFGTLGVKNALDERIIL